MSYANIEIKDMGNYLKIPSGETAHIHIVSKKPKVEVVHGYGKDRVSCLGDGCQQCGNGEKPTQKFLVNVFDRKANMLKVWEFGIGIAKSIKENAVMLAEEGKTVHDVDFKIRAKGEKKEKRYTIMQAPKAGDPPGGYFEEFVLLKQEKSEEVPF